MATLKPFQLLEINIISTQDLEHVSKKMKTYAVAWVNRNRKLSSRVDSEGNMNPTWNDKFVFRVDEEFLQHDTSNSRQKPNSSAYSAALPPPTTLRRNAVCCASDTSTIEMTTRNTEHWCGRIGQFNEEYATNKDDEHDNNWEPTLKPILHRSKSERSESIYLDTCSDTNSSLVVILKKMGARGNGGSILSISEAGENFVKSKNKKGKPSLVVSGAELQKKSKQKSKKGKASSVVSESIVSKETSVYGKITKPDLKNKGQENMDKNNEKSGLELKVFDEKPCKKVGGQTIEKPLVTTIGKPISKYNGYEYGGASKGSKFFIGAPFKAHSIIFDSEVEPPPSGLAAMMVERKYHLDDN
ncbi:uncharacterized protein LOC111391652 [Olea europaea subsp. europaea]|uniref:Uncharacterized protein LOC111391652 n=1 Tax=Olea europaea subsp. europaea TaxID=158383 RepID=A0A8S0PBN9_OLEEU|nr:uncharacterized protein LOC111391652 [Olea europaea subsp. europaea]